MNKAFNPLLIEAMRNRKVVELKYRDEGGIRYPLIILEGGFEIAVFSDDEGNDGGVLSLDACPGSFAREKGLIGDKQSAQSPKKAPPAPKPKVVKAKPAKHPESDETKSGFSVGVQTLYKDGIPSTLIFPQAVGGEEEETEEDD